MIKEHPGITLDQAWEAFFTVPKAEFSESARKLLDSAKNYTIPFGDIALAASEWGTGETILLVHGWGGHRAQLGAFVEPLVKAGFRVVSFDGPAHGETKGEQTNLFEYRKALLKVAEIEGPVKAVLAHSLGALVNMMALDAGLDVEKVVQFGSLLSGDDAVNRFHYMVKSSRKVHVDFKEKMVEKLGPTLWEDVSGEALTRNLDVPALLIHDEDDEITPLSDSTALANTWSSSELVTTKGLSHRSVLRDAGVVKQVVDFIAS